MSLRYTPDQWRDAGYRVTLRERSLFYRDSGGDKTPVLLIHGFPTSSWDWEAMWDALTDTYRVIAPDMLGFGFSDKPADHEYSIIEQADLIEDLVQGLGLGHMHVIAHDYGDTVAQELLARQNAEIGAGQWLSLCLLNGGLFPETHQARFIQKLLLGPLGPLINRLTGYSQFRRSFSAVFGPDTKPDDTALKGFWECLSHNDGHRILYLLIHYMRDRRLHRSRWVSCLQNSRIPIGLINGSLDPVSGSHMVERYRELIERDDFVHALPRIGHYPQCEDPEGVLAGWRCFIETRARKERLQ